MAGAMAIRLPLLSSFGLHPDEQTFLNVGHSVALGHLPYLQTWDNKPPLLSILVAPITVIAHHQIWIVRVFAALLDIVTSLLVKRISDRLFGESASHWLSAIWCFAAISLWDGGGALMSETIALPLLMGGVFLICGERVLPWQGFLAGLLLGAATLVRGLPAFSAAAVVVFMLVEGLARRDGRTARAGLAVALGGLCMLALMVLPYVIVGATDMLMRSMLLAPIAYVEERGRSSLLQVFADIAGSRVLLGVCLLGVAGLIRFAMTRSRMAGPWRVAAMLAAQLVGASQGPPSAFYLVMLVPFACVLAAPAFSFLLAIPRSALVKTALCAVLMFPVPLAARTAIKRGHEHNAMTQTRAMLSAQMKPGDTLYLTTDYLLYWLLERSPPHPIVTHAGNLFRPHMFRVLPYGINTSGELARTIMATRPTWIIFGADTVSKYAQGTEVGQVMQPVLASQYVLVPSPPERMVYHLRDQAPL